ncbi:unnamed protein product [marine sediment metagenome]|uniref:Uncharacterized protein n=1 Tax=marine sediment metagenome TaxID=412755 RepID=X0VD60_9ZZZZ
MSETKTVKLMDSMHTIIYALNESKCIDVINWDNVKKLIKDVDLWLKENRSYE